MDVLFHDEIQTLLMSSTLFIVGFLTGFIFSADFY